MLTAEEMPLGTFFSVAVSPDGKTLAIGAGGARRQGGQRLYYEDADGEVTCGVSGGVCLCCLGGKVVLVLGLSEL